MLYALDSWVIDKCERFSHWTQRRFGLKSDTWERWSYVIAAWFTVSRFAPGTSFLYVNIALTAWLFLGSFRRRRSAAPTFMNPRKLKDRVFRSASLVLIVLLAVPDFLARDFWYEFVT